jgi:transcriptional regulator GlxA family with amidase domain
MGVYESIESFDAREGAKLSVGFVLAPRFTLIAFAGFMAVLRHASDAGDKSGQVLCRWTIMGPGRQPIASSAGVEVIPWEPFRDPAGFDYVVIVGGRLDEERHYTAELLDYLRLAAGKGCGIVGLCTGSFYMARAGLMRGRKCCVHWYHFQDFIEEFPDVIPVTDEIFIVDRKRITCPGGTSGADLALHLVERHLGKDRSLKAQRHLLLDWGRPPDHPQLPLTQDYAAIVDPRVRKAVFFMEQHMSPPLTMESLAAMTNTSVRQLERLFHNHFRKGPVAYYREIRLVYGRWLLANTDRSITAIAYDCGFTDASHFSRWFKEHFGVSPASLRR